MSTAEMAQAAIPGRPTLRTAATIAPQLRPNVVGVAADDHRRQQVVHHVVRGRGTVAEAQPTLARVGDGLHQQHRRRVPGDRAVGFRTVGRNAIHARLEIRELWTSTWGRDRLHQISSRTRSPMAVSAILSRFGSPRSQRLGELLSAWSRVILGGIGGSLGSTTASMTTGPGVASASA